MKDNIKTATYSASLCRAISEVLSILAFLTGCLVLIGWAFDIPFLKSISPDFITMKANTAVCFVFIGLSLWLSQTKRQGNRAVRGIARLCAFVVFLTGFLTFCEYILGVDFGIDQFLFKESASAVLTSSPGRMAVDTSINFVIISIALLLFGFETALFSYLAQLLVIPVGMVALLAFVGYLYGATPLYIGKGFTTAMALHTSVLFIMSCIGCLFARPQQGLMKNITSDNYGGLILRRILPVVIVIPPVLGWLKVYGVKTGFFDNEFGTSFVAVINLFMVSLFVYILSFYLNMLDTKRKRNEEEVQSQRQRLANILEGTHVGTWEWNVQTGETLFNERWAEIVGYTLEELAPISIETWLNLSHPDDAKNSEILLAKHFAGELDYYDCECRMKHKNGSWVWVHDRGRVIERTLDGKPLRMFGTHEDITVRKQAEDALRESRQRFQGLVGRNAV